MAENHSAFPIGDHILQLAGTVSAGVLSGRVRRSEDLMGLWGFLYTVMSWYFDAYNSLASGI